MACPVPLGAPPLPVGTYVPPRAGFVALVVWGFMALFGGGLTVRLCDRYCCVIERRLPRPLDILLFGGWGWLKGVDGVVFW